MKKATGGHSWALRTASAAGSGLPSRLNASSIVNTFDVPL